MRQMLRVSASCFIVTVLCVAFLATVAGAQSYVTSTPGGRAGTWDFFLPLTYFPSQSWDGQGGSGLNTDATFGFGFGFGYNLSDHFALNGLFSWSARNYNATVVNSDGTNRKYGNTLYTSTFSIGGVFYILPGNISPFVAAGVGITYLDSNIPNGGGSTSCWWDPWYGYVCTGTNPTKTQSDVSYNLGLGVRFDLNRQFAISPAYYRNWVEVQHAAGTPYADVWRLDFIFRM